MINENTGLNKIKDANISEYTAQIDAEIKKFDLLQRKAKLLANSTIVPKEYRAYIEKKENFTISLIENPNAISNCVIAIDMAHRMNANELMIMQNLSIIQGRPSWSSQWIIAAINTCGRYSALKFELKDLGKKIVIYNETYWENKKQQTKENKVEINDFSCRAYVTEKSTGDRLESAEITIKMAVEEGWYTKTGSKWKTMPEIMLRYRAASFFGKIYAPDILMGIQSVEENQDISDLSVKYRDAIAVPSEGNINKSKFNPKKVTKEIEKEIADNTPIVAIEGEEILPEEIKTDLFDEME